MSNIYSGAVTAMCSGSVDVLNCGTQEICGDAFDNDCDGEINGEECCTIQVLPDIDFGTFSPSSSVQEKSVDFGSHGWYIAVEDYPNSCENIDITVSASSMTGADYGYTIGS